MEAFLSGFVPKIIHWQFIKISPIRRKRRDQVQDLLSYIWRLFVCPSQVHVIV